tara:strand:- start:2633 stop:5044 length:2412 start_codon:yes stop_codon:yes gene_type:complete
MSTKYAIVLALFSTQLFAQNNFKGIVVSSSNLLPVKGVEIYEDSLGFLETTDADGIFSVSTTKNTLNLIFYCDNYLLARINVNDTGFVKISLSPLIVNINEVEILVSDFETFNLDRLLDIENTSIYSGKKTEVIRVDESILNFATNNARQVYSQISGLNVFQNDDAGLQLNIGGRGLDPNRTSNFNTRQNSYDISADVLGYPESYYTPPLEAVEKIQIVRGAASLQYGTQFGGLVNFVLKSPNQNKPLEVTSRNTIGSNKLFANFTSFSGKINKLSYYSFVNYKKGEGFRPNSSFNSINLYGFLKYDFSNKLSVSSELTFINYLTQQAGGLTDQMFEEDPLQSNRSRNWFEINWLLYSNKLNYIYSKKTNFSFNFFGLKAQRNSLGYRTNRVNQIDNGGVRDLIVGEFNNYGLESKVLSKYNLFNKSSAFVFGSKLYISKNVSIQGPGSNNSDSNFETYDFDFPYYKNQSEYIYPNKNISFFMENVIYVNKKMSITPGLRYENIKTESDGFYRQLNLDAASNPIFDTIIYENNINDRQFLLLGFGLSYKWNNNLEMYSNLSQNYRSVTFSDISIVSPTYSVDPNIKDEKGYTLDLGLRGRLHDIISYDVSSFFISYQDRIGFIQRNFEFGGVKSVRDNVGDAIIYGFESILDFNLKKIINLSDQFRLNLFVNFSQIESIYIDSDEPGIEGNSIEYVPNINAKTGLNFGLKRLNTSLQYTYLSKQFSDASNAIKSNSSGIIGQIPSYSVLDFSMSYRFKFAKLEFGINNFLDSIYFNRRAVGYPGPGIIPSPRRNFYLGLELIL